MTDSPIAATDDPDPPAEPAAPRCPYCDRVMSWREHNEQGACNDCHGGAYLPDTDRRSNR